MPKKRGRPVKLNYMALNVLMCLFFFPGLLGIKTELQLCSYRSDDKMVLPEQCGEFKALLNPRFTSEARYAIAVKRHHMIMGIGTECKYEILNYNFVTGFWAQKSLYVEEKITLMSQTQCSVLTRDRLCGRAEMRCTDGSCFGEDIPTDEYRWWDTVTKIGYRCWLSPKRIVADELNSNLFGTRQVCKAEDYYCKLADSVVIWNQNIIHDCPFERIDILKFVFYENFKMIFNRHDRLLFVLNQKINACNTSIYTTNEKIFIAIEPDKLPAQTDTEKQLDLSSFRMLGLAESDLDTWDSWNRNVELEYEACLLMNNNLEALRSTSDMFHRIYMPNSNASIVVYAINRSLFLPSCLAIQEFDLVTDSPKCYQDFLVRVKLSNFSIIAFLSIDNILRYESKEIDCNGLAQFTVIKMTDGNDLVVKRNNNKVSVQFLHTKENGINDEFVVLKHKLIGDLNLRHYNGVLAETDLAYAMVGNTKFAFQSDGARILSDGSIKQNNGTRSWVIVESYWDTIKSGMFRVVVLIAFLNIGVFLMCIFILLTWLKGFKWCVGQIKRLCCCKCCTRNAHKNVENRRRVVSKSSVDSMPEHNDTGTKLEDISAISSSPRRVDRNNSPVEFEMMPFTKTRVKQGLSTIATTGLDEDSEINALKTRLSY